MAFKPALSDCSITNQKGWRSLTFSLLMSLVVHAIVAGNLAPHTDDGGANPGGGHSTPSLLASLVLAKPQPAPKFASPISKSFDNAADRPDEPSFVVPREETAKESPYVSPDSIEQMASVIELPDLPLPSDSLSPEGFMRIKVFVNEHGFADNVELLESNFAEEYASMLVGLFKSAKFSPGVLGGKTIKSWRIVEIDYSST